jgi:hypothetical protein
MDMAGLPKRMVTQFSLWRRRRRISPLIFTDGTDPGRSGDLVIARDRVIGKPRTFTTDSTDETDQEEIAKIAEIERQSYRGSTRMNAIGKAPEQAALDEKEFPPGG